jgi:uncharacterized membrane protein
MYPLDILAALILIAILFLIYCFIGFSRAQHSDNDRPSMATGFTSQRAAKDSSATPI